MKCLFCGSKEIKKKKEDVPLIGLPMITLVEIEVDACGNCGEYEIAIPHYERLIDIVTLALLNKKGRLSGREIRWLRGQLGWASSKLAEHVGVSPESVSKWENGRMNQTGTADRLIRLIVAKNFSPELYSLQALPLVSESSRQDVRFRLRHVGSDWKFDGSLPKVVVADPTQDKWAVVSGR